MMNLTKMSEVTGLSISECRTHRTEYLKRHIKELSEDVAWYEDNPSELSEAFGLLVFEQLVIEAKELRHLVMILKGTYQSRPGEITEEMIQVARSYPIEQLIEFDRSGKALAFCHADNHPSLTWHRAKNRATCFPCGKSFSSIDVLSQRDGLSFPDAVRRLVA